MAEKMKKLKLSIKEIETIKKTAETKLVYLNPKLQMVRLFVILLISFLGVILASLIKNNIYYIVLIILVSVIFFIVALRILWKLMAIIVEVKKIIDDEKREIETKTVDALLALQEKFTPAKEEVPLFLKKVSLNIEGVNITDEEREFEFPINIKKELSFSVHNKEDVMVKNFETGLTLPSDFTVEKSNYYSIFTDKNGEKTIRYEEDKIHAFTVHHFPPLIFTPIAEGKYDIRTFIKAENIKPILREIKFKIEEEIPGDEAPF